MEEKKLKEWFAEELRKFDFPCWCYKSDLVNMFENIIAKIQGKRTAVDRSNRHSFK